MKRPFKLYWVKTPSPDENCFVAARSQRAAAKYEEDVTGFDPGDCDATEIRVLDEDWVNQYRGTKTSETLVTPFYIQPDEVHKLGIKWRVVEGDDVFEYGGRQYSRQGDLNYVASLGEKPQATVIRSVADLLRMIRLSNRSDWIFRGHSSSFWSLDASVHRLLKDETAGIESLG